MLQMIAIRCLGKFVIHTKDGEKKQFSFSSFIELFSNQWRVKLCSSDSECRSEEGCHGCMSAHWFIKHIATSLTCPIVDAVCCPSASLSLLQAEMQAGEATQNELLNDFQVLVNVSPRSYIKIQHYPCLHPLQSLSAVHSTQKLHSLNF